MSLTNHPEWESLSRKLSKKEAEDPYLVIYELFDFADLPDVRYLLWEWLKCTVNGNFSADLEPRERSSILFMYEKIEKLVEAAHLLHLAHEKQKKKKKKK